MGASRTGGVPQGRWCVPCCTAVGSRDSTLHSKWLLVQMLTQVYRRCCLRDCCCACAADRCLLACLGYCLRGNKKGKKFSLSKVSLFLSFPGNRRHYPNIFFLPIWTKEIVLPCTLKICIKLVPSLKCYHLHQRWVYCIQTFWPCNSTQVDAVCAVLCGIQQLIYFIFSVSSRPIWLLNMDFAIAPK